VLAQQRDEKPPDAAVAVEVGMDGLELHVEQPGTHERRQRVIGMDVLLERTEHMGRWWYVGGIARPAAADPVLAAPYLARQLVRSARTTHEALVRPVQVHCERAE